MKIKVIMTDKAMDRATMDLREEMLQEAVSNGVEISVDCIKKGPDELDCNTDEAFAAPEMIKESIKAEKEGYEAIVIYCFSDVGLDAIRENVNIPVIGPGELSVNVAGMICNKFLVITTEQKNVARTYRRLRKYPMVREKMSSVKSLDVPIGELENNPNAVEGKILSVCQKAIEQEQIDGAILGCLGMARYKKEIEDKLPICVLDPALISVAYAELCIKLGIRHPKISYPHFLNESHVDL